jgi:hypothetical protein
MAVDLHEWLESVKDAQSFIGNFLCFLLYVLDKFVDVLCKRGLKSQLTMAASAPVADLQIARRRCRHH